MIGQVFAATKPLDIVGRIGDIYGTHGQAARLQILGP